MQNTPARPHKILIVDDDARIRDLLRRYLAQEGLDVLLAEDGKALSRIMLRETVDLIVLDLMLPGEDGLSICRRLRASSDNTPIVMLTAKGADVERIPNPLTPENCWHASMLCCAGAPRRRYRGHLPQKPRLCDLVPLPSIWRRANCNATGKSSH